ncbi:MAG: hypothetical protein ACRD6R_04590 [Candidatus Polarisedimenticolia bacterium]
MSFARNHRLARLSGQFAMVCLVLAGGPAAAGTMPAAAMPAGANQAGATPADLARSLGALRPDYLIYIAALRPLAPDPRRGLYMALVLPGADDPRGRGSAPLAGRGARNDVVFDTEAIAGDRSDGFRLLLLDHEYFHARHLAGATTLPVPTGVPPEVQRRFNEAAAWGFNIEEARAGRYPGLRQSEFREALDRFRDHYVALRQRVAGQDAALWRAMEDWLRRPGFTTGRSPLAAIRWRPSATDRSPAIP